jgi:small subunit ribosomal protein S18e
MEYTYDPKEIQHIIRLHNTNIDGTHRVPFAITKIVGIGKRMGPAICKRVGISASRRAGDLSEEELKRLHDAIADPTSVGIPEWFLNHRRDLIDGTSTHLIGTKLDAVYRMMIERGKKIKHVRICRLAVGLRVRGQRTKCNGRKGKSMGVSRKK